MSSWYVPPSEPVGEMLQHGGGDYKNEVTISSIL